MTILALIYLLDAVIVGTYLLVVLERADRWWFDWVNGAAGPCLILLTVVSAGWQPILLLTVTFTIAGWIGVMKGKHHA